MFVNREDKEEPLATPQREDVSGDVLGAITRSAALRTTQLFQRFEPNPSEDKRQAANQVLFFRGIVEACLCDRLTREETPPNVRELLITELGKYIGRDFFELGFFDSKGLVKIIASPTGERLSVGLPSKDLASAFLSSVELKLFTAHASSGESFTRRCLEFEFKCSSSQGRCSSHLVVYDPLTSFGYTSQSGWLIHLIRSEIEGSFLEGREVRLHEMQYNNGPIDLLEIGYLNQDSRLQCKSTGLQKLVSAGLPKGMIACELLGGREVNLQFYDAQGRSSTNRAIELKFRCEVRSGDTSRTQECEVIYSAKNESKYSTKASFIVGQIDNEILRGVKSRTPPRIHAIKYNDTEVNLLDIKYISSLGRILSGLSEDPAGIYVDLPHQGMKSAYFRGANRKTLDLFDPDGQSFQIKVVQLDVAYTLEEGKDAKQHTGKLVYSKQAKNKLSGLNTFLAHSLYQEIHAAYNDSRHPRLCNPTYDDTKILLRPLGFITINAGVFNVVVRERPTRSVIRTEKTAFDSLFLESTRVVRFSLADSDNNVERRAVVEMVVGDAETPNKHDDFGATQFIFDPVSGQNCIEPSVFWRDLIRNEIEASLKERRAPRLSSVKVDGETLDLREIAYLARQGYMHRKSNTQRARFSIGLPAGIVSARLVKASFVEAPTARIELTISCRCNGQTDPFLATFWYNGEIYGSDKKSNRPEATITERAPQELLRDYLNTVFSELKTKLPKNRAEAFLAQIRISEDITEELYTHRGFCEQRKAIQEDSDRHLTIAELVTALRAIGFVESAQLLSEIQFKLRSIR